ncbi:hypothetical protein [Bacillus paranthracis]|uniref:hypothetical protein n=1 Tax=Bacillus paranthracis TaxID=2026186 RepID=UPI003D6519FD
MIRKKTSDKSNSNFRQQESAMKELDKNVETLEQRNISQTKNVIESPHQETDQGKLQKQPSKLSQHTSQEFHQPESTPKVQNKTFETTEQKQFLQTTSIIESPKQDTNQGKLQKQSSKLFEHTSQELHQPESTPKVLNKIFETAEQKQYTQTTSTIESPQQETGQGKLQKQSPKLSEHINQEFHQPENTAKVQNKTFGTTEQKQFLQTTSIIESPKQDRNQGKLQKQSSKLSEHINQEFHQPENTAKVQNKTFGTTEQKQFLQTTSIIESLKQDRNQGKLQRQSSKLSQHIKQELQPHESAVQRVDHKVDTTEQKQVSQTKSAIEIPQQETKQGKLQKQSSKQSQHVNQKIRKQDLIKDVKQPEILKTSQQNQIGQTGKSLLKENGKDAPKSSTDNSKIQKGMRFVGKLGNNSLIATKAEVKKNLIDAKNSLKYGTKTTAIATKDSLKGGIKKYQTALEREDEGVRIGSQGVTQGYRATRTLTRKGFGLAKKGFKKLRHRRREKLYIKTLDKGKLENYLKEKKLNKKLDKKINAKKLTKATAKKLTKVPVNVAGSSALKYQEQLEKGDEGVKLASQSATKIARATKKLTKNKIKANAKLGKMGKQQSKLVAFPNKDKKLKVESRSILKKKAVKKKMYYGSFREKNKAKTLTSIASNVKNQVANLFKSLGKINIQNVKKLIGTKIAAIFGGGLASAVPLLLIGMICLLIAGAFGAGSSSQEQIIRNR